jgi:NAD(P)-dependent dehydrogenase (short-subunit alcohol dehydrogenase family)
VSDPHAGTRLFELTGKSAFVAGGYGGIGSAIARGLAQAGASVVLAGRSAEKAARFARALCDEGHDAHGIAMDGEDTRDIRRAVDEAAERSKGLDLLVNCIGFNREQRVAEVSEETFDEIYRANLRSAMFLAQAALRHQAASGRGGRHVHLLSVRSQLGMHGFGYSAYCATKGALVMLVKQHAVELAEHGVNVNGIAPTVVDTSAADRWKADPKRWAALLSRIPMGRVARPDDIVGATIFFCAPASSFVTGQILYLDGGLTATQ